MKQNSDYGTDGQWLEISELVLNIIYVRIMKDHGTTKTPTTE
jgi:hypothetical protein